MNVDRSETFPVATCSIPQCLSDWSRICQNCLLAFCGLHAEDHQHWKTRSKCKPEDRAAREKLYVTDIVDEQDPVEEGSCPPPL